MKKDKKHEKHRRLVGTLNARCDAFVCVPRELILIRPLEQCWKKERKEERNGEGGGENQTRRRLAHSSCRPSPPVL